MNNPFLINGYDGPKYFCDRKAETASILRELSNGNNLALIAPRRMGKSGLIQHCFGQSSIKKNYYTFYIDVYATRSLQEFVFRLSREIVQRLKPFGTKVVQGFWNCVKSLQAGISFSPMGEPSFNLQLGEIAHCESTLEEIFSYLSSASRPCIVAIDEFQQIANYSDKNVEALLRTYVQKYPQIKFIFAGSQRHLLSQMFTSPSRPFYHSVSLMNLDCLNVAKYATFAKSLFEAAGKSLGDGVVEKVFEIAHNVTWYVQKLMNTIFAQIQPGESCSVADVSEALDYVLGTLDFSYRELMFRIPDKQREVLIAIAKEGRAEAVTSGTFLKKYHLNSASTVQSALRGLLERDYVTQEQGCYYVYDQFLMYWLQREY